MSSEERPKKRRSVRRGDEAGNVAELLTILQTVTADGRINDDEAKELAEWLGENRSASNIPGFHFLDTVLTHALSDGILTLDERREIYKAIEKVLPVELRREAKERRAAVEIREKLEARAEKEVKRQRKLANTAVKSANFLVAGVGYEGRKDVVEEHAAAGDVVYLVRDSENKHDRNAIEVRLANNLQIGYVPADIAAESAHLMDSGFLQRAYITKLYEGKRHLIPVVQAYLYRPEATVDDALSPEAVSKALESATTPVRRSASLSRGGGGCFTTATLLGLTVFLLLIWLV